MTEPTPRRAGPVFFLIAMGVYLIAVHAFAWDLLPPRELAARLALLYAAMAATFFLTKPVTEGPWWLGSLTAVLLMAHPVKTGAVVGPQGEALLLDALGVLVALAVALWIAPLRHGLWGVVALGVFLAFTPLGPPGALPIALALYIGLVAPGGMAGKRATLPLCLAAMWAITRHHPVEIPTALPGSLITALLPIYPIGLLPETAALIAFSPALAWALLAATAIAIAAICRTARHPGLLWCALVLPLWTLLDRPPVDPVHLHGGGRLMVPIAIACVGFAALCRQAMRHPAWGRHVVGLTTLLCLVFFAMQVRAIREVHRAAAFHAQWHAAAEAHGTTPAVTPVAWRRSGQAVLAAPDPSRISALFPMAHRHGVTVEVLSWLPTEGRVRVSGASPAALLRPYWQPTSMRRDAFRPRVEYGGAQLRFQRAAPAPGEASVLTARIVHTGDDGVVLEVRGEDGDLPPEVLAFPLYEVSPLPPTS